MKNKLNNPKKVADSITKIRINSFTDIKKHDLSSNIQNNSKNKSFY
jgi:hypothetical protein